MTTEGAPSPPPLGHPGPRWAGDGALGGALPTATGAPAAGPGSLAQPHARIWRRAAGWLIDYVLKTFLYAFVVAPVIFSLGSIPPPNLEDPVTAVPVVVLHIGYDWIFWGQGWSPGGRLMRLRMVRADGAEPGFARAAIRALTSSISMLLFFVGHVWLLWDRKQSLLDRAAGTYVVELPE